MMVQLLLSCRALSSPTLCRFIPALSERPLLYAYLHYMFENLPLNENEDEYRSLLPQYIDKDLIIRA